MSSLTVRISKKAHRALRQLADLEGASMRGILDKAIEEYRRKAFLMKANAAFEALRNDTQAWQEEQKEREQWDAALSNGL